MTEMRAGPTRRGVLKLGLAGSAALVGGGWIAARLTDGRPAALVGGLAHLDGAGQQVFARLGEAMFSPLTGAEAWPAVQPAYLRGVDQAIATLPAPLRGDLQRVLAMLGFAPARLALTGRWLGWAAATPAEVAALLEALRGSSITLRRLVAATLHDIAALGFYGLEDSWPLLGYPGPLLRGPGEEV